MHLYKAEFNHLTISIIGNSSKKIHQVICHWIGYHFYDATPWNLTKSDWHLNSCLEDEEGSKRKEAFWFHRDCATIVCVWASVSATGHNWQDLTRNGSWVMGISKESPGNGSLACHICAKSTNAQLRWVLQEYIKISYFVPLFENRRSVCIGKNLGGPLWLDMESFAHIERGVAHGGEVEKGGR